MLTDLVVGAQTDRSEFKKWAKEECRSSKLTPRSSASPFWKAPQRESTPKKNTRDASGLVVGAAYSHADMLKLDSLYVTCSLQLDPTTDPIKEASLALLVDLKRRLRRLRTKYDILRHLHPPRSRRHRSHHLQGAPTPTFSQTPTMIGRSRTMTEATCTSMTTRTTMTLGCRVCQT